VATLRREHAAEIARSKELQSRAGPSIKPNISKATEDPAKHETRLLYEAVTNLLVTHAKIEPGIASRDPDCVFHCIYTANGYSQLHLSRSLTVFLAKVSCRSVLHTRKEVPPGGGR